MEKVGYHQISPTLTLFSSLIFKINVRNLQKIKDKVLRRITLRISIHLNTRQLGLIF